ncbi:hypothetical protein NDQ71_04640 [Pseudoalteromonas sp. KG3]|uniref:hypothetical protein n=1 Tax=Pseudoalteromonas sp. KG3 TaxID=2951137 RepID=UPI00265A5CEA|nr:hypothetical protein [Pseudoalteromonas sp. KG3]WKD24377.1 hypothetical protein NDQ71_04640 [Pseudoalteromonas sp. KG3]
MFAWLPATFLMIIGGLYFVTSIVTIFFVPLSFTVQWLLPLVGGFLGYLALTSLSWGVNIALKKRLIFLILGVVSLLYVYWLSCNYQGEIVSLSLSWYKLFIIGGPLFFSVIHILLHLLWLKKSA